MKSRAQRYRYVRHVAMSCFPDGGAAPPTISYASPQSWTYGVAISTLSPTTTGATSFAVQSGTLPTGVSLNTANGDITGTPTTAKVAANVVIRATGPGGTADATINIAVPSPLYTSLVDYWNLDEASGNAIGSHAGLTLTDTNTVTSQATGGPDGGRCRQFTAANTEYFVRADEAAFDVGAGDFTLAAWAYQDSQPLYGTLFSKGDINNAEYTLAGQAAALRFLVDNAAAFANDAGSMATGAWRFCVGYCDTGAGKIYAQTNNGTAAETAHAKGATANASSFAIGLDYNGPFAFDGRMAYAGMWKRKLTAAQLTWLYNSGAGRAYSALATYDGG